MTWINLREIYDGQSGTMDSFYSDLLGYPCQYTSSNAPHIHLNLSSEAHVGEYELHNVLQKI